MYRIAGKFGGRKVLVNLLILSIWQKKVWQMNRFTQKGYKCKKKFGWV